MSLSDLLTQARACTLCADILEPRPVLRLASSARVLIVGQAPGSKVHASGVPWQDASGDHLLEWLGVERAVFEDATRFGILPMAFCYPGKAKSGDLPPPPICAETWHGPLVEALDEPPLTLLIGQYAQERYLGKRRHKTLTETVRNYDDYAPAYFPLPHPSWRSRIWMGKNPWFEAEVLPVLRRRVGELV